MSNIKKNTYYISIAQFLQMTLAFFLMSFAAQKLGDARYGKYALASTIMFFVLLADDLGINIYITREASKSLEKTKEFFEKAFSRPDFVGWHYCGLIDTWVEGGMGDYFGKTDEFGSMAGRQHTGLLMADGTPYQPIQKALKESTEKRGHTITI